MSRYGENIYKRKDGRWEGRYIKGRSSEGKIQYGYVYSRKYTEVRKKLFLYKIENQVHYLKHSEAIEKHLSFADWAALWLSNQKQHIKPNTYASYQTKILYHLNPFLGEMRLDEISSERIQACLDSLQTGIAESSKRAIFRILKTCLEKAKQDGYLKDNPCKNIRFLIKEENEVRAFSKDEQFRIEELCRGEREAPILFALHSGLRIGEISGLKWTDIDWENKCFSVKRSVQRMNSSDNGKKTILKEASLKTRASRRTLPLSKRLFTLVVVLMRKSQSEYVFSNKNGQILDPRTIRYRFSTIKNKAGISDLPFHALRHTFATRCMEVGVPVTTISALLGHQSVKMTLDTYTNSFLSEKERAISQLETNRYFSNSFSNMSVETL